jgi:hypothetical protein
MPGTTNLKYVILACAYEIQMNARPEKHISTCSDNQAALKALKAAKITSLLIQQCQKALNNIFTQYSVELFWDPRHPSVGGSETASGFAREGNVLQFVGPVPVMWASRQKTRIKIKY